MEDLIEWVLRKLDEAYDTAIDEDAQDTADLIDEIRHKLKRRLSRSERPEDTIEGWSDWGAQ